MNLAPLEQINNLVKNDQSQNSAKSPEALRRAAEQFEAILLMQLTSALNDSGSGDEESLFGSDGGSDLAKKMFSEQLATTMAQSGGIGLADVIVQQASGVKPQINLNSSNFSNFTKSTGAIKSIKNEETAVVTQNLRAEKNNSIFINKSGKITPVETSNVRGNSSEAEIISTFEDEARSEGIEPSVANLILDGKIQNSTRARIVPNAPINEIKSSFADVSAISSENVSATNKNSEKVDYQIPAKGRISSDFGMRFHPIEKRMKLHGGLDIAAPRGTPIGSAADGEVVFAGKKGGYGNMVIVEHADGKQTRYGHADKLYVQVGEKVSAGQTIAAVGSTGKSTGPHLHFEVLENGQLVNPSKILSNVLRK